MKFYSSFPITAQQCFANRAVNYGDGLFETMLLKDGRVPLWSFHMERLQNGLSRLNLQAIDEVQVLQKLLSLVTDDKMYVAKLVVFRDDFNRGYGSNSRSIAYYLMVNSYQSLTVNQRLTVSDVRLSRQTNLAGLKHLNRLEQVMAAQQLQHVDFTDALMLDHNGCVIETISKNVILIKNDEIYTPLLDNCGVYGVAIRWLMSQGFQINWKKIAFESLSHYHGMMVSNSLQGFNEIKYIDDTLMFKNDSPVIAQIKHQWQKYMILT